MDPIRVFIVDDDRDFSESLAIAIEGSGYEVELAYNGEDAIEIFREKDFDIAFMDVKLPGKNGVESFMEIKKFKPGAKVVMMTGYSVEQLLDQAVANGAWGVIYKPVNMPELIGMVKKVGDEGILIVDDDLDFISSLKDFLANHGYKVFCAENGEKAIEYARTRDIDILILDLKMPFLNGLETYLEIKKIKQLVPTIIVTAFADEEKGTLDELRSMSVNKVLRKPFNPKELLETISELAE